MFHKKGYIGVDKDAVDEDTLLDIVLEAGGEDMSVEDKLYSIITSPQDFDRVVAALEEKGIKPKFKEITMIPSTYIKVDGKVAEGLMSLMDALNEHEDVQQVYANFDIPDELYDKKK
jgi:transcriptional/translational regulatory protein YebC/TACO1